jgi:hypothetical protein
VTGGVVFFPIVFPTLNDLLNAHGQGGGGRGNGYARMKRDLQDQARIFIRLARRKGALVPIKGPVFLAYEHRRRGRRADPSNVAAAAMKIIEDALVCEGIIENDTWNIVAGFSHKFTLDKRKPGVLVQVGSVDGLLVDVDGDMVGAGA